MPDFAGGQNLLKSPRAGNTRGPHGAATVLDRRADSVGDIMTAERGGLRIRLLGPVHAVRDGAELALGSAHPKAVFAALATNANRCLSREDLVNAVWGDDPPPSATGNIYTYVSTLRRVLEPDRDRWSAGRVLSSGGGSYCLHVAEEAVDACRFETLRED